MKFKLLKVLTVCLVTVGVLAPALVTFGIILKPHINQEVAQHLVYELKNSSEANRDFTLKQGTTGADKEKESLKSCTANLAGQLLSPAKPDPLSFIFFVIPSALCLAVFLYDKYSVYRTTAVKEQVEMLERLWQQSIHN